MIRPPIRQPLVQMGSWAALGLLVSLSNAAIAQNNSGNPISNRPANSLMGALSEGQPTLSLRGRVENVDQDDTSAGHANTLLTKLGYTTSNLNDFTGFIEFANVSSYWNAHHNSGNNTTATRTRYAVIPDAKGTAMTRAYVAYSGLNSTEVLLGRQVIRLDNERFVGKTGFRQIPTTFDALTINTHIIPCIDLFIGQLFQVHTNYQNNLAAFNGSQKLRTFLGNATWSGLEAGKLTAYAYLNNNRAIRRQSQDTFGLRWNGDADFAKVDFSYTLEYAHQHANHNRPINYTAIYKFFDIMAKYDVYSFRLGVESLGGDRFAANRSFVTPLGTLHNFQGWADQFLNTPNQGVRDYFGEITSLYGDYRGLLSYHSYRAQDGGKQIGTEWNFGIARRMTDRFEAKFEYANFDTTKLAAQAINGGFRDVTKLWFTVSAKFH